MVRGREFNYSFGISLLAGLLVAFFGLGECATSRQATVGRQGLLGAHGLPRTSWPCRRSTRGIQRAAERTRGPDPGSDHANHADSLARIVIGKLMTQWVKLVTLFSGMAPFITMSFLLGGIDLLTILISPRGSVHVVDVGLRGVSVSVFRLSIENHVCAAVPCRIWEFSGSGALVAGSSILFYALSGWRPAAPRLCRNTSGFLPRSTAAVLRQHDEPDAAGGEPPFAAHRRSLDGFACGLLRPVPAGPAHASSGPLCGEAPAIHGCRRHGSAGLSSAECTWPSRRSLP